MINLAVIFGGMSTEHDVSIVSGTSVIKNLDKSKYSIIPIYLDKEGKWYKYNIEISKIPEINVGDKIENITEIENIFTFLNKVDCIFPVLHGLYGEDGSLQGMFELIKKPYVGCKVLSSSISMDKVYTKIILDRANIKQAKYVYIRKYKEEYIYIGDEFDEKRYSLKDVVKVVEDKISFPMFIKPSNSGSSIGINRAKNIEELEEYIKYASKYDNKILIEEGIQGREVECAVLGNEEVEASCIGEIIPAGDFYSFDSKYKDSGSIIMIPAEISENKSEEIKDIAIKAFKAVDGKGLSRVDFFIENDSQDVYINEINTLPGFTKISMYPKLFEQEGMSYSKLLDNLVDLAME